MPILKINSHKYGTRMKPLQTDSTNRTCNARKKSKTSSHLKIAKGKKETWTKLQVNIGP